jgi:hypothetical protein
MVGNMAHSIKLEFHFLVRSIPKYFTDAHGYRVVFHSALFGILALLTIWPMRGAEAESLQATYNSEWAPYSFGSKDLVDGILPDLMTAITANQRGLEIENHGQAWATVQRSIRRSQLDAFVTTPTEQRLSFTFPSESVVYAIKMVPIVRKGGPLRKLLSTDLSMGLKSAKICGIKCQRRSKNQPVGGAKVCHLQCHDLRRDKG